MNAAKRFTVVSNKLPEPPYEQHVSANGFGFDLNVDRMQNSDSWLICPHELRPWMMMTWVMSWSQRPCGTLPADEEILAARLGCSLDFLQVHRRYILRGWVRHADDRLYHPVVTEEVLKMLAKRDKWRTKKSDQRQTNQEDKKNVPGDTPQSPQGVQGVSPPSTSTSTSTSKQAKACSSSLSPSSPPPPAAADAAGVSERSDPAPTPTAQAATDAPSPRSAPKPKVTPWPRFDDFWSAYPNKKAKEDARRAWNRMRPPPDVIDTILADLPHRATSDRSWLDGYIPNPATYLNGRRWEDVITPATAVKTNGSRVVSLAERNAAVFDDFLRGTGTNGVIEGECQRV